MAGKRKIHGGAFKAQVALSAHKGDRTVNELAGHYGVHPTLIHAWKKQLLSGAEGVFASGARPAQAADAQAGPAPRSAPRPGPPGRAFRANRPTQDGAGGAQKKKSAHSADELRRLVEVGH